MEGRGKVGEAGKVEGTKMEEERKGREEENGRGTR